MGVVQFALYTDILTRHTHAQPFKLQLLLSAEGKPNKTNKQTQGPGPSLPPPHLSVVWVIYFGFQRSLSRCSRTCHPVLRDTLQQGGVGTECLTAKVYSSPVCKSTMAILFLIGYLGLRVLPYQVEISIYLTSDMFLFCLGLAPITSLYGGVI